jgi:hypothetical protein
VSNAPDGLNLSARAASQSNADSTHTSRSSSKSFDRHVLRGRNRIDRPETSEKKFMRYKNARAFALTNVIVESFEKDACDHA